MKILFIGDIFGRPGREAVAKILPQIKVEENPDLVFANCENAAGGKGMTLGVYQDLLDLGINYLTSGNHIWAKKDFVPLLSDKKIKVLRPANYPSGAPGRGFADILTRGTLVRLVNLQGRVFLDEGLDSPFKAADEILKTLPKPDYIIIDFHAEVTSEKAAFAYYLDGRASAIIGTHTHIQTNDLRVLPQGTAFITDVGFTGPRDSVIGVEKEEIIHHFLTALPFKNEVAEGEKVFSAVLLEWEKNKVKNLKSFLTVC
ncbi:TIGR00282 family metallophosphoesterase [Candidatus Berkelbacteria bacterium]|nr:TIGR00282 family metallophosphoesterase [Candidatus Berkelbacteria bacterium]